MRSPAILFFVSRQATPETGSIPWYNKSSPCVLPLSRQLFLHMQVFIIASDAERARKRAYFHSHMGLSKNVFPRNLLIFSIRSIEQKMFIFDHTIDSCDEQARAVTLFDAYFSVSSKDTKFEILTQFGYQF